MHDTFFPYCRVFDAVLPIEQTDKENSTSYILDKASFETRVVTCIQEVIKTLKYSIKVMILKSKNFFSIVISPSFV